MKTLLTFFIGFLAISTHSAFAAQNQLLIVRENAFIANRQLYIRGKPIAGCMTSVTNVFQTGKKKYAFLLGCDGHPYSYSFSENLLKLVSRQPVTRILGVTLDSDGYAVLNTSSVMTSIYAITNYDSIGTSVQLTASKPSPIFVRLKDGKVSVNGKLFSGVSRLYAITGQYSLGKQTYFFATDENFRTYVYSTETDELTLINVRAEIRHVISVQLSGTGNIYLNVMGAGGTIFDLGTTIYTGL